MAQYDHKGIEAKWQRVWEESRAFVADDAREDKEYLLVEFPYPSGDGLHVGHLRSYTAMDVIARKRRMEGKNVLYPIGWDAFGLPAENYAVKHGEHPRVTTARNIANFKRQLKAAGFSFDWSREVNTTDPAYYKWTQWIFLKLLEHGLAYKAAMPINWCPSCKIGLANEEAVGGVCERCGSAVERRTKEQWMLKITAYADKLLEGLDHVDYIERAKVQQRNWIGKSEGAEIVFPVRFSPSDLEGGIKRGWSGGGDDRQSRTTPPSPPSKVEGGSVTVFTTRPDTLFGATFLVVAPETAQRWMEVGWQAPDAVRAYVTEAMQKADRERTRDDDAKTGVPTGLRAVNPANNEEIPVWVADYVLAHYGTGAIMAVPAHDERDFAFAQQYGLPVRQVIRKVGAPIRSYVMGTDDIAADDFIAIGVSVGEKTAKGFYKVEIPRGRERAFEDLIVEKMTPGFWNEYVGDETIFLFKHKDGRVERLVLNVQNVERIDQLACEFNNETYNANDPGNYINGALARNEWYRPLIVHSEQGTLINSGAFDGIRSEDAKRTITEHVGGKMTTTYRIRDWVFSRQRYWGEPIPVVFCAGCATISPPPPGRGRPRGGGARVEGENQEAMIVVINDISHAVIPVPEDQLPLELPDIERYEPTDTGESPLAAIAEWVNTKCPRCGGPAKRETDVMPNWAGSSWYFLRYCDPQNNVALASPEALAAWMPVDWYNGGMEHTTLHLLYSRFWSIFLHDIGAVPVAEPYAKRTSHGLILAEGGEKMSKSKGNIVNPDGIIARYGADAVRVYEMFIGPFDQPVPWSENGLVGCRRFLEKVWAVRERVVPRVSGASSVSSDRLLHRTIKKVGEDIEAMRFNTAVAAMMEYANDLTKRERVPFADYVTFLALLAPFAPHLTEELHEELECRGGGAVSPPPAGRGRVRGGGARAAVTVHNRSINNATPSTSPSTVEGENQIHSIFSHPWPSFDPAFITEEEADLIVQVNGKHRATLRVPANIAEADATALALAEPKVAAQIGGATPKKVIFVPGRIVNIVV